MKVVILAGGYGTRLSEETEILPKPMIEIGGRPLLWHLMKSFAEQGFNEFVVALGYKGDVIKRYFMHYADTVSDLKVDLSDGTTERRGKLREDWKIELVDTGQDTMTGSVSANTSTMRLYLPMAMDFRRSTFRSSFNFIVRTASSRP